jgi:hypothetical protein
MRCLFFAELAVCDDRCVAFLFGRNIGMLLLASACSSVVIDPPSEGPTREGESGEGAGGDEASGPPPYSTSSSAPIPHGTWAPVAFDTSCPVEVTAGAHPDVKNLELAPCNSAAECSRWPVDSYDVDFTTPNHLWRVDTSGPDTLVSGTLRVQEEWVYTSVWDASTGRPIITWRTPWIECSLVALTAGEAVWLTVQDQDENQQRYVRHGLYDGSFQILPWDAVQPSLDGNDQFFVGGRGQFVWSTDHVANDAFEALQLSFSSDSIVASVHKYDKEEFDLEGWVFRPGEPLRKVLDVAPGLPANAVISASDDTLVWIVAAQPDPLWGEGEVRKASLPLTAPTTGQYVTTIPTTYGGRNSSRYFALGGDQVAVQYMTVVDLDDGHLLELPMDEQTWQRLVIHVGKDSLGDREAVWYHTGLALFRQELP